MEGSVRPEEPVTADTYLEQQQAEQQREALQRLQVRIPPFITAVSQLVAPLKKLLLHMPLFRFFPLGRAASHAGARTSSTRL